MLNLKKLKIYFCSDSDLPYFLLMAGLYLLLVAGILFSCDQVAG